MKSFLKKPYIRAFIDPLKDSSYYYLTGIAVALYWRYVLNQPLPLCAQILGLVVLGGFIYCLLHFSAKVKVKLNSHIWLVRVLCIAGFALGGFSQSELQALGFQLSANSQDDWLAYLFLKSLFYAVGIIALPRVLTLKSAN